MYRRLNLRPKFRMRNVGPWWRLRYPLPKTQRVTPRLFPMLPTVIKDRIGAR